ncbi:hypothetical protein EYR40_000697 [Pleurotus pulmonarius]|nr:hypothetical protein EYR40_000697 [Pleurotus pulmonarius]
MYSDRREHGSDKDYDRVDKSRYSRDEHHRRDDRRDREREVDRRDRREPSRRDHEKPSRADDTVQDQSTKSIPPPQSDTRDPKERMDIAEEGEAEDVEQDDSAMMAMMGLSGFGTTKAFEGNQEGGADIKKIRTWRQYMNRRGGFNRPLDKIK